MAEKPTRAEQEKRVNDVFKLLVRRKSREAIIAYAMDKYGIKTRQADALIQRATKHIKELAAADRESQIEQAIATLVTAIDIAVQLGDTARITAAQRELNQLLALYAPPAKQTIALEGLELFSQISALAAARNMEIIPILQSLLHVMGESDE